MKNALQKRIFTRKGEGGVSLGIGLGVVAAITGILVIGGNTLGDKVSVEAIVSGHKNAVSALKSTYRNQNALPDASILDMAGDIGAFPSDWVTQASDGSWTATLPKVGGSITAVGNGDRTFTLTYGDMTKPACIKLIVEAAAMTSLEGIDVGSTSITLPTAAESAASTCSDTAASNDVALTHS